MLARRLCTRHHTNRPAPRELQTIDAGPLRRFHDDIKTSRAMTTSPPADAKRVCCDIIDSLRGVGFLHLENTPLEPALINSALDQASWLFSRPEAEKALLRAGGGVGGAEYNTFYRYEHEGGTTDGIEAYNMCNDRVESTKVLRSKYYEAAGFQQDWIPPGRRNAWPSELIFRQTILSYWDACVETTDMILFALECEGGLQNQGR